MPSLPLSGIVREGREGETGETCHQAWMLVWKRQGIIIAWTSPASNDMSSYRSDLTWEGTWQTSARVYNRLGKAKAELAIAIHPIPVHYSS